MVPFGHCRLRAGFIVDPDSIPQHPPGAPMLRAIRLSAFLNILLSGALQAQDLPLGEEIESTTTSAAVASYAFTAESSGVLTVVVRANNDVVINVVDGFGRQIDGGYFDTDYGGDTGAEQAAIIIGGAGDYQVRIEPLAGDADFVLATSWLPMALVARTLPRPSAPDPQGSPEDSIHMGIGKIYRGSIHDASGDVQDWFRIEAARNGVLNVSTRTRSSDVVLEYYQDGNYGSSLERSDQDLHGDTGNESITVSVREGGVYYFVVTAYSSDAEYSVRAVISDR